MELKANYKLMMVGSLETDIEDVCNVPFHNRDVIDDFDDNDNDDKCSTQFHNMEVNNAFFCFRFYLFCVCFVRVHSR